MHAHDLSRFTHAHEFGGTMEGAAERRTRWVVLLTSAMMIGEITAGLAYGSMALLADGWHMATHASALGVALFAYSYARRHASDRRYTFGTGKVTALGGFASAVGLAVVALLVLIESGSRLAAPTIIQYDEAIAIAILGLAVNVACAVLLRHDEHEHDGGDHHHHHHHDLNLRGAYLHVLADAVTSMLAIFALLAGRLLGWTWMDPVMGMVGAVVIARWSWGLLSDASRVLLDAEANEQEAATLRSMIESDGDSRVSDLHLWRVGPQHLAAIVSVVTHQRHEAEEYKARLSTRRLAHLTVEVQRCPGEPCLEA